MVAPTFVAERICSIEGCDRQHRANGYCSSHRSAWYRANKAPVSKECRWCASPFLDSARSSYCSSECRRFNRLNPLRFALIYLDDAGVLDALERTTVRSGECWIWNSAKTAGGYPSFGTTPLLKGALAHRLVAERFHGDLLGQPVHHTCANRACLNPEHLQPISSRENTAEMQERTFYLRRIAELEAALSEQNPGHPLLRQGK